jgi:hypothetical protein
MPQPFVIPIGPLFSFLDRWFRAARERLTRDSRNPYIRTDEKTFGFSDAASLPSIENDAVALAEKHIAAQEFELAKKVLVKAWQLIPSQDQAAFMRLREGFVKLYAARGETDKAQSIASMPIIILDREVQNIVTHPHEQIGGSGPEGNIE